MFKKLIFGVLTMTVLLSIAIYLFLLTTKPQYDGLIRSEHVQDSVSVIHDKYGVPHIYAENAQDAYYTLGYLHAQERLFQMEIIKRVASGRLSEVVGEKALKSDKFFRTLGIDQQAKESAKAYLSSKDLPYQKAAWAYIDGINEFIKNGTTPLEFHIMGIPKEKFTPEDIYHTIGFMSFGFADGFREDPLLTYINDKLGAEYLSDILYTGDSSAFIPVLQSDTSLITTSGSLSRNFYELFEELPTPMWLGSNGWAVSGSNTASGKPILSNDTHIGYAQPSVWFDAHIEYPGFRFYGQHAAGIPFGVLGHNEHLGWGFTMFENDDVDFYTEEITGKQYLFEGSWRQLESRTELIKVKDQDDLQLEIRKTHHGPIVNDVFEEIDNDKDPISVWWAFDHFPTTVVEALYQLNHAENIDQVANAAAKIPAPGLNLMYADHQNIAWWALAKLPIRPSHVNSKFILDGTSGKDDHLGYYPFSKNPHNINPESGIVYTTNNQPETVDSILYPGYYRPKDRASRAHSLLSKDRIWKSQDFEKVQLDITSPVDASLSKLISKLLPSDSKTVKFISNTLQNWDGSHTLDSSAPSVYYALLAQILIDAMSDELGYEQSKKMINSVAIRGSFEQFIDNEQSVWWDNINTSSKETRDDIISQAASKVISLLSTNYGNDVNNWNWSKTHQLTHKHPLAAVKPLDMVFNVGPYPITGGIEVLNNQKFKLDTTGIYDVVAGPAVRWVLDFADLENSMGILPTGQSGHLMSDHYRDQAQMFVDGEYRKQMMNKDEIMSTSESRLLIIPNN